jgi:hypothetical protein
MARSKMANRVWMAKLSISAIVVVATVIGAFLTPTPLPLIASGATLVLLIALMWPTDGLPILLLPTVYQWSVVAMKPIRSAIDGTPLYVLASFGGDIERAAIFGMIGICALALGMKAGVGRLGRDQNTMLRHEASAWPRSQILGITIIAIVLGHALDIASSYAGPARQVFLALGGLRYAGLFALTYWCLSQRQAYGVLALVLATEILFGMTGFFADFRGAVLTVAVAALAARPTLRMGNFAVMFVVAGLVLSVAVFWSAVKVGYRDFVSLGTGEQVVSVPVTERIDYLSNALDNFDSQQFNFGLTRLLDRHSYIDFLASTLSYVPRVVPHEGGVRLLKSLQHIATPRIFFPNKPPTPNDSQVTAFYTGLPTTQNPNASISIGYLGEFYIDFGYVGAIVACFAMGWLYGRGYRFILTKGFGSPLFLYGLCVMTTLVMSSFETALIKLVGGVVTSFLAAVVISRYVLPQLAPRMRRKKSRPAPTAA